MSMEPQKKVAIIGLGLLGASFGMALRGKGCRRLGWTRKADVRAWAVDHDVIDETADAIETVLGNADLTVFALPIPQIMEFMRKYAACWKRGAVVTDMGSVKTVIMNCAEEALIPAGVRFVGGHPMAGTEKSGYLAAFETLYQNAEVFICPSRNPDPEAVEAVENLWRSIGTKTVRLDSAEAHDELVAHTSHVLHIVASALSLAILDDQDKKAQALRFSGCATGFKDTSRIASSNPAMWREIIEYNTPAVLSALKSFEVQCEHLRQTIQDHQYDKFQEEFARGKMLRDSWVQYKGWK